MTHKTLCEVLIIHKYVVDAGHRCRQSIYKKLKTLEHYQFPFWSYLLGQLIFLWNFFSSPYRTNQTHTTGSHVKILYFKCSCKQQHQQLGAPKKESIDKIQNSVLVVTHKCHFFSKRKCLLHIKFYTIRSMFVALLCGLLKSWVLSVSVQSCTHCVKSE